jgi:enterochelin esterase-like enzyme
VRWRLTVALAALFLGVGGYGAWAYVHNYIDVGRAGVALDELLNAGRTRPFLIVIPLSTDGSRTDDTEWANAGDGPFESELIAVVRQVDEHWPTIPDRSGRALAGLSMGGYGALNIGLHHLGTFGTLESWSGYFTQTRTGPFAAATPAMLRANSPAAYAPTLARRLRRLPLHVFLYTGRDDPLISDQGAFAAELRRLGVSVRTAAPGGMHDWALWRAQMPRALLYAGRALGGAG